MDKTFFTTNLTRIYRLSRLQIPQKRQFDSNQQRAITQKLSMQSCCPWDMHTSNVCYLPMQFQVNRFYGFKVMLRTKTASDRPTDGQTNQPTDRRTQRLPSPTKNLCFGGYNNIVTFIICAYIKQRNPIHA